MVQAPEGRGGGGGNSSFNLIPMRAHGLKNPKRVVLKQIHPKLVIRVDHVAYYTPLLTCLQGDNFV